MFTSPPLLCVHVGESPVRGAMNRTYAETAVVHPLREGKPLAAWFILTAGVILAVTGAAKIWSALGTSKFLAAVDPILGIKVWAIAVGRGSGRDCGGARVLLQPTANAGARLDSLAGHELSGLSRRPVVDGLEAAVWVSGESHGRPPPLAAGGGEHHESPARLPAHRQLRAGDLALAATKEQSGRRDFATGIIFGWLLTFIGMANISTPDQTAPRWLRMSKAH